MVEVFRTNLPDRAAADALLCVLNGHFPGSLISVDLEDCDRVLRFEAEVLPLPELLELVARNGVFCEILS